MSKTRIICHIVFVTKHRQRTIPLPHKRLLYGYIMGIVKNKNSTLIRINGVEDHVHMLVDVHPTVAVSDLVKAVKQFSSRWMKATAEFHKFNGWGEGFFAASVSANDIEPCRQYIINQEIHHRGKTFDLEMETLVKVNGFQYVPDEWL